MRVIYSEEARTTLDGILNFIGSNYPTAFGAFQAHFDAVLARITEFPESAHRVDAREGVRVAPLVKYPYKLFYRYQPEQRLIEIVYIRHTARDEPPTT